MTHEELEMLLVPYLAMDSETQSTRNSNWTVPLVAPFGDFFGDRGMLKLFRRKGALPPELEYLRKLLHKASDELVPETERGFAALEIARRIIKNRVADGNKQSDSAEQWLDLAMRWGSVVACKELAELRLAESGLALGSADERIPLPSIVALNKSDAQKPLAPKINVRDAWESGAHLALASSTTHLKGWDTESLLAAFACVTNYAVFLPVCYGSEGLTRAHAQQLAKWVLPLLERIKGRLRSDSPTDNQMLRTIARRLHAVRLMLEHAATEPNAASQSNQADACGAAFEYVVVIKGQIPPASNKDDNTLLAKYESLRMPMPLAPMPSMARINDMRCTLAGEFPWAARAIDVIFNELLARKRHGSNVLGMQPVLLVGLPATGKTRLAQRLSELLSIPCTVISMAAMSDARVIKGTARGWSTNRPSRILESIASTGPSHLFLLDEVDKAQSRGGNGGSAQEALLDMLEPGNARRFADEFILAEADISHCLYVLTSNSLDRIPDPLLSRVALAYVPPPGPEHSQCIAEHMLRDLEKTWRIPAGTLELTRPEKTALIGLSPREMRRAILAILGKSGADQRFTLH